MPVQITEKRYAKKINIELSKQDTGKTLVQKIKDEFGIPETRKIHMMYCSTWGDLKSKVKPDDDA